MKRFQKIYLEISNVCNLRCSFCPGTRRKPGLISEENFSFLLDALRPYRITSIFISWGNPWAIRSWGGFWNWQETRVFG